MTQSPLRVYARHDADFSRPLSAPPPAASVPSASTKGWVAEFYDSHKGGNVGYDCWQLGQFVSRRLRYVYEDHEDPRQLFPILHLLSSACLLPTPSPKSVVSSPTDISRTANRSRFNPRARQYFVGPSGNHILTRKQPCSSGTYAVKRVDDHYYCKCPVSGLLNKCLDCDLLTGTSSDGRLQESLTPSTHGPAST